MGEHEGDGRQADRPGRTPGSEADLGDGEGGVLLSAILGMAGSAHAAAGTNPRLQRGAKVCGIRVRKVNLVTNAIERKAQRFCRLAAVDVVNENNLNLLSHGDVLSPQRMWG